MPHERLKDLQRQRARVQEQLDRLDREIAETASRHSSASQAPVVLSSEPEAISPDFLQFESDPDAAGLKAKRGCLLYFTALMLLGALICTLIYFWHYRDRPVLLVPVRQESAMRYDKLV